MKIFWEIHDGLPQQGPGDDASTRRALALVPPLPERAAILDVGCGPGRQTMALARLTGGTMTAVDTHQPFLDELERRGRAAGVADRIRTVNRSMSELDFPADSFDLVWSEGAVYLMGFRRGLASWRRFVKPGKYLAVSEITWLTDDPAAEAREFWAEAYPPMKTIPQNLLIIEECGYSLLGHFILPESSWWDGYYRPVEIRLRNLRDKYAADPGALEMINSEQQEIDLFRAYPESYGYVFYVMQRRT